MPLTRRSLLRSAAAGLALASTPFGGALARTLGPSPEFMTARGSRLFPGAKLAHGDLHNHTLLSDGTGQATEAYESMRSAGLDIAAITDHSVLAKGLVGALNVCGPFPDPPAGERNPCTQIVGFNEQGWEHSAALADIADAPGAITAVRGFEWSSPFLGHLNVWFSSDWTDPLNTLGLLNTTSLADFIHDNADGIPIPVIPEVLASVLGPILQALPDGPLGMRGVHRWLARNPATPLLGGGSDAIFGFNHPGREPNMFSGFELEPALVDRAVSIEVFNRHEDYLFRRTQDGVTAGLVQCLDAGWKPGILGVTDEHGADWGYPDGKGRTGLWVSELTRAGVREAMESRRFFATRLRGLRVDGAANGVRMGQTLGHRRGPVLFELDIDRGPAWWGKRLNVQILRTGSPLPTVIDNVEVTLPRPDEPWISFTRDIDVADGTWLVLRVSDPDEPIAEGHASAEYQAFGNGVAYLSPIHLDPDAAPPAQPQVPGNDDVVVVPPPAPGEPGPPGAPDDDHTTPGGPLPARVRRLAGADRIATAIEVSRAFVVAGTPTVWVASASDFPDALAAGPAAALDDTAVLLTHAHLLDDRVRAELVRIDPERILIAGGPGAVTDEVAQGCSQIASVERIAGPDRVATAAAIALHAFEPGEVERVVVATAGDFPDALAGGAVAGRARGPVLLTQGDALAGVTREALVALGPSEVIVLGGTAALGDAVVGEIIGALPGAAVSRIAGPERIATAAELAAALVDSADDVLIATGTDFPDALAAVPLAVNRRGPVLLSVGDSVAPTTATQLRRLRPAHITVVGGTAAVSAALEAELRTYETGTG